MNNKDIDAQFLCKDCTRYNLCEYYHRRRKDSYICKYFHLSVTPHEPQTFKWCTDCKEYDQEKHCCHRWSKVIRDTVEEMKQDQEPITKILEDIKGEVFEQYWGDSRKEYFDDNDSKEYIDGALEAADYIIKMIDKHNRNEEKE